MSWKGICVGLFLYSVIGQTWAASFNCQKAATATEKAICQQPILREVDRKMSKTYFRLQHVAPQSMKTILHDEQRYWLGNRDRCKRSVQCLVASYETRQQQLDEYIQRLENIPLS
jgi:uncharacterized protein